MPIFIASIEKVVGSRMTGKELRTWVARSSFAVARTRMIPCIRRHWTATLSLADSSLSSRAVRSSSTTTSRRPRVNYVRVFVTGRAYEHVYSYGSGEGQT
ncbi:unnamed protein product [Laminaria digitata]